MTSLLDEACKVTMPSILKSEDQINGVAHTKHTAFSSGVLKDQH